MIKKYSVRVFSSGLLEGTTATVYYSRSLVANEEMQSLSENNSAAATCFLTHLTEDNYHVRFFNSTHEILLCGHGLLACAKVALSEANDSAKFQTRTESIEAKVIAGSVWLKFNELKTTLVPIPQWANDCFNQLPVSAAEAGPENGYIVMNWPIDFDLSKLTVNENSLVNNTARALIATQQSPSRDYDYYFRYFAPQHGVIEDKATGSANRVLVSYWSDILDKSEFRAKQLSAGGAELLGRIEGKDVWISGKVSIEH